MFKVKKVLSFSAAHALREYKGKCEALHGHNWKVEVTVSSQQLNSLGMVIDFVELKEETKRILEELDHKFLNDLEYFCSSSKSAKNPSSEEIARYIYLQLEKVIKNKGCKLEEVSVWETETSCATYQGK